jgi:hypothetical protein
LTLFLLLFLNVASCMQDVLCRRMMPCGQHALPNPPPSLPPLPSPALPRSRPLPRLDPCWLAIPRHTLSPRLKTHRCILIHRYVYI